MNASSMITRTRRFLRNRTAVAAAATAGFVLGAAGFAAADGIGHGDHTASATSTTDDTASTTTDDTATSTTVDTASTTTDATSTTTDATASTTTDATSTTTDATASTTTVDTATTTTDATSTTVDVDDRGPVAPFTRSYRSGGGSITVSWNGSSLSLDAVSPEPGYHAEIEDNRGDRVRVDFESDDDDTRIEIRVDGNEVRERVEG